MANMTVLTTKNKALCDRILELGGRLLSKYNDVAGGSVYSLDVSGVEMSEIDTVAPYGVKDTYKVFSVEHPTLMF